MKIILIALASLSLVSCSARDVSTASLKSELPSYAWVAGQSAIFKSNVMLLWKEELSSEQIVATKQSLGELGQLKSSEVELRQDAEEFQIELRQRIGAMAPEGQQKWVSLTKKFEETYAAAQVKRKRLDEILSQPEAERDLEELKTLNEEMIQLKKEIKAVQEEKSAIDPELYAFEGAGMQSLGERREKLEAAAAANFQKLSQSADLLSHPSRGVGPSQVWMGVDSRGVMDISMEGLNIDGCVGNGFASSMANIDARRDGVIEDIEYRSVGGVLNFDVHLDCGVKIRVEVNRSSTERMDFVGGLVYEREGVKRAGLAVFR